MYLNNTIDEGGSQAMRDALFDLLGNLATPIKYGLALIAEAESLILTFKHKFPDHAEALDDAFGDLAPVLGMGDMPRPLYAAHCFELLRRVIDGEDMRSMTQAEALYLLSLGSLRAPLNTTAFLLYVRLFRALYPEWSAQMADAFQHLPFEPYEGAVDRLHGDMKGYFRRHCRRGMRK